MARILRKKVKKRSVLSGRALSAARVAWAVKKMGAPAGVERFKAGKAVMITAEKFPERVYPHFDAIAALLNGEGKIVRWNAMRIIALLAKADDENKVAGVMGTYLGFIRGPNMISAANAILGAAMIARAKPELRERIVAAILGVETAMYETAECRNVAIGHALKALEELGVCGREEVMGFVRRQCGNTRAAVARRAREMAGRG